MPLAPELVAIAACPKCKGKLEHKETEFVCHACRLSYAIVDDLPNFIIEEARPLG
jgi:uncharacterized protein YbaR (Trm112 family)